MGTEQEWLDSLMTNGIAFDSLSNNTYTGISKNALAGEILVFGSLIYLDSATSKWKLCNASADIGQDGDSRGIIGMCVQNAITDGITKVLLYGVIRADSVFPTLIPNKSQYISTTTGLITENQPVDTDNVIRVVGFALTPNELLFCPSPDYITHI